jgi:hypothetical protein
MFVDAGCQGRISDSGDFTNTELYKKLETKTSAFPFKRRRKKCSMLFFIEDEAFSLSENLMKVYPGQYPKGSKERIFNYRICRARRVVTPSNCDQILIGTVYCTYLPISIFTDLKV